MATLAKWPPAAEGLPAGPPGRGAGLLSLSANNGKVAAPICGPAELRQLTGRVDGFIGFVCELY